MRDADPWLAEAAMHRVLRRTLPAQRHDVLGALSALKLQLAVARRRLQRPAGAATPDDEPAARLAHLESMAEQQLAAQTALTELRLWDGVAVQRRALDEVIGQCLDWVRQAAALRGHRIEALRCHHDEALPAGDDPSDGLPWVEVPAAHYLVLGLAYAVMDALQHQPACLVPELHSDSVGWRLSFQAQDWPAGEPPPAPMPADANVAGNTAAPARSAGQEAPQIDLRLLSALASHCSGGDTLWTVTAAGHAGGVPLWPVLQLALVDDPV